MIEVEHFSRVLKLTQKDISSSGLLLSDITPPPPPYPPKGEEGKAELIDGPGFSKRL